MLKWDMEKYSGLVQQLLLTAIIGVVSIGVGYIGELSKSVQAMSASVQELNIKTSQIFSIINDHEIRLRDIENKRK